MLTISKYNMFSGKKSGSLDGVKNHGITEKCSTLKRHTIQNRISQNPFIVPC